MAGVQAAINSMIGSASGAIMLSKRLKEKNDAKVQKSNAATAKGVGGSSPQKQAMEKATQSAANAIEAKKVQRRNFMEYLRREPTNLGGTVGDLPPAMQKQIAAKFTKSQRQTMMNRADKERLNGKH